MGLSSNILWHQTKKKGLEDILKSRIFKFSYSQEKVPVADYEIAFPMISFCDLPFSEFANYMGKYGGYSIGLSRNWGKKNHFNPVWYCYANSIVESNLFSILRNANPAQEQYVLKLAEIIAYVKPVEGKLNVKGRKYLNYRFMDEREVRLVPPFQYLKDENFQYMLSKQEYIEYKKQHNEMSLLPIGIKFEWNDIKYIVVQNEPNIVEFKNLLHKLGCTNENISIFYQQQIKEDFIGIEHDQEQNRNFVPVDIRNIIV